MIFFLFDNFYSFVADTVSNCLFAQMKSIDATKDELLRALIAEDENVTHEINSYRNNIIVF